MAPPSHVEILPALRRHLEHLALKEDKIWGARRSLYLLRPRSREQTRVEDVAQQLSASFVPNVSSRAVARCAEARRANGARRHATDSLHLRNSDDARERGSVVGAV